VERNAELVVNVIYKTALFDATTIEQMLERYEHLLAHFVKDPDARLLDVALPGSQKEDPLGLDHSFQSADQFSFES
jgi:hypothetical protein